MVKKDPAVSNKKKAIDQGICLYKTIEKITTSILKLMNNSTKKPFKTIGARSGKTPDRYFSLPNYQTDGIYMDPNRRNIKQQLENNLNIIHEKAFKVMNPRKVEYFSK